MKNDKKDINPIKFILFGKVDMKYEISISDFVSIDPQTMEIMGGREESRVESPYSVDFQNPIPYRIKNTIAFDSISLFKYIME